MKKVFEFLKTNFVIAKWTFWYFLVIWCVLTYVFKFDMFSRMYWWKFFHAHLHGFIGFVFGALIYTMVPIYIATVMVIYRTKEPIIKITFLDKIYEKTKGLFASKKIEPDVKETQTEPEQQIFEYPTDLPNEMRIPFKRITENIKNNPQIHIEQQKSTETINSEELTQPESFPIPTDFDINDSFQNDNQVPTFTEINFDTSTQPTKQDNTMIKYLKDNNIEYETYNDFIITQKHLIYVHNDSDFWIIDENNWFAAGKQIDSPVPIMMEMTKDEQIIPVIYFETTNIMDFEGTKETLNTKGIKVITKPDELN